MGKSPDGLAGELTVRYRLPPARRADQANSPDSSPCLSRAWGVHATELRNWIRHQHHAIDDCDDILQEVFVKALKQGQKFCGIDNPRAWLFQVARNTIIDRSRTRHICEVLTESIPDNVAGEMAAIDRLTQCLPRVLSELHEADRMAIVLCDIEGKSQQVLAEKLNISLSGAKSRIQRARQRLRERLQTACKVRFDESGAVCCFTPRSVHG